MNKTLYIVLAASSVLVSNQANALPISNSQYHPSENNQLSQPNEDIIILADGSTHVGSLNYIPPLDYPFGRIQIPVEEISSIRVSSEKGLVKLIVEARDGNLFIGDLPREATFELKSADNVNKKIAFDKIDAIHFKNRNQNQQPVSHQQNFAVEFLDGSILPVEIGDYTLVLNDGQKDFTIEANSLVDIHNDNGLHGIVRTKEGQYKHIPLAIVKDDTISTKLPASNQSLDLHWKDIARIYQHNPQSADKLAVGDSENKPARPATKIVEEPRGASPTINPKDSSHGDESGLQKDEQPDYPPHPDDKHLADKSDSYLITPVITNDGKTSFYRVVGRLPSGKPPSGATFASWPNDIVLVGEDIRYEPKKRSSLKSPNEEDEDDHSKDDDSKKDDEFTFASKEQKHLKAIGGATRKPLLAQCCILKDEPIALVSEPAKPQRKSIDPLQDDEGYYKGPASKIHEPEEPDSLPQDPDLAGMVFINEEAVSCSAESHRPEAIENVSAYYIDKYPVSNKQYYRFVKASNYPRPKAWLGGRIPRGQDLQPVVNITYADALAYAKWAGKRLPTEFEWCRANHNNLIKTTTKRTIREWTATPFVAETNSRAEQNWSKQNRSAVVGAVYRAVVGGDLQAPIPQREEDVALNIGFRTALEAN